MTQASRNYGQLAWDHFQTQRADLNLNRIKVKSDVLPSSTSHVFIQEAGDQISDLPCLRRAGH